MTLRVVKEPNLGWSARVSTKVDKFAPNGKPISEKQITNLKELGISVDGITETETLVCTLNVGSGYSIRNMSLDCVKSIRSIVDKHYNNKTIVAEDTVDLHEQIRVMKDVKCKPIDITLIGGESIHLTPNEARAFEQKLPDSYKDIDYKLSSICGYSVQNYGSDIKVGCHYHNFKRVIDCLDKIIAYMENPTDAQTDNE